MIYDARDNWEAFSEVGAAPWYQRNYERYVARQSDVVTAVSWPLAEKIALLAGRDDVIVSQNALDDSFPRGERKADGSAIVVGYFGHLTEKWFDWDLILQAAHAHPDWTFELAGHQAPDIVLPANVKLLGLLSHAEIASVASQWRLAMIPFKPGVLTEAVDPIKVYEYLHLGLPVVATYFPQMMSYPMVSITDTQADFLRVLEETVSRDFDAGAVDAWLQTNRWHNRVAQYRDLVDRVATDGGSLMAMLRSSNGGSV